MTVRVSLSIGEDYPHLFVSDDPDEVRYADTLEAIGLLEPQVAVDLTDQEWAEYKQAEDAYYAQVVKLASLREGIVASRPKPAAH